MNSADLAQARLFDAVLRGEIAELRDVAASTEARWMRRRQSGAGDDQPPEELLELRARLKETQRLLDNLRDRFPQD